MTIDIEAFAILRTHSRSTQHFDQALQAIADGVAAGGIRNVVLNDAKHVLSSAVYDAWRKHVQEPYFYAGRYERLPKDVQELDWKLTVSNLHDVVAAAKRLEKSTLSGPAIDAMREFMREVLPLSQAVASLKDKIVMGRAPNTGPAKPENPDKIVKTCACCFRPIAVVRELMAHHGYQRPGSGWQTASCPGVRFRPLEVSSDGLAWLTGVVREQLANTLQSIADLPTRTSISELRRTATGKRELVEVKLGEPGWVRCLESLTEKLDHERQGLERELKKLEPMLRDWKPQIDGHALLLADLPEPSVAPGGEEPIESPQPYPSDR